jgi:hypothetical protein
MFLGAEMPGGLLLLPAPIFRVAMKRRRNITEERLMREASRALMRLSRYREKHGLSGPMADIVISGNMRLAGTRR